MILQHGLRWQPFAQCYIPAFVWSFQRYFRCSLSLSTLGTFFISLSIFHTVSRLLPSTFPLFIQRARRLHISLLSVLIDFGTILWPRRIHSGLCASLSACPKYVGCNLARSIRRFGFSICLGFIYFPILILSAVVGHCYPTTTVWSEYSAYTYGSELISRISRSNSRFFYIHSG